MRTAVARHPRRSFSGQLQKNNRKVALGAAFRWSPVVLAFIFSSLCISFFVNLKPAAAISTGIQDRTVFTSQKDTTDFAENSDTPLGTLSPLFTKEVSFWKEEILDWAETYHLDPNLVAVVMQIESCGHPSIESRSGAKGLFQVMPFHFSEDENPFNPDTNAQRGLSYLSKSLSIASNDPALALAGYNGGHSVIPLGASYWSDETKRYVYWGTGILADIYAGKTQSPRLNEWMQAGGESLCFRSSIELGL